MYFIYLFNNGDCCYKPTSFSEHNTIWLEFNLIQSNYSSNYFEKINNKLNYLTLYLVTLI